MSEKDKHIHKAEQSHGDGGHNYFMVDKFHDDRTLVTHKHVIDYLRDNDIEGYSCGHSHDCCGCVFAYEPVVVAYDDITEQWIVRQDWGRNV